MSLQKLRSQVDRADEKIVHLLNNRAKIVLEIAKHKNTAGTSIYCPDRERQVLEKIERLNRGPLPEQALTAVYREIMSGSIALEKKLTIAFLGPEATFTHQAALKRFGSQLHFIPCDTISDVFGEVEKDKADYGVVPVENSIEGAVNSTLDMLVDSDLKICAQVMLGISHTLVSRSRLNRVSVVYSKAEVFGQCRTWLLRNLPGVENREVSSTGKAAQMAAKTRNAAAIASELAAQLYGVPIIARNIEDSPRNMTKFFVIGKTEAGPTGKDRTSILFSIRDSVGALHDMLLPFKKYRINLTKIESRPVKKKAWDYYFFVDLEGHCQEPKILKALSELGNKCKFLKILGSYPIGK